MFVLMESDDPADRSDRDVRIILRDFLNGAAPFGVIHDGLGQHGRPLDGGLAVHLSEDPFGQLACRPVDFMIVEHKTFYRHYPRCQREG